MTNINIKDIEKKDDFANSICNYFFVECSATIGKADYDFVKSEIEALIRESCPKNRTMNDIDEIVRKDPKMEKSLAEVVIEQAGWNACRQQFIQNARERGINI